ncbi:MAG TPA: DUF4167 domain-containing protein [Sphingomonas sp.]|nr:DUF4167 domain-containing protein [Sphingomonas sp.]
MINNRQGGGRRRGRGGQRPQGNPGQPGGGNRIDNRARGNAQQLHEKYKNLARDSQMAGDRVTTEYYLQFADHYFRVLNETRARFEDQRRQRDDVDDDFEADEPEFAAHDNNQRRDRNDNYKREEEARPAPAPAPAEAVEQQAANDEQSDDGERRARRGRRRREAPEQNEQAEAIDADRLPPAIAIGNGADEAEEAAAAPRRRGRRPRAETANDTVEVPPAA